MLIVRNTCGFEMSVSYFQSEKRSRKNHPYAEFLHLRKITTVFNHSSSRQYSFGKLDVISIQKQKPLVCSC